MIEYILLAVLSARDIRFEVSGDYHSVEKCHEAKFFLHELKGIEVIASACVEKGQE